MRQFIAITLVIFFANTLTGCFSTKDRYLNNAKLVQENWHGQVERDPTHWMKGADIWFFTGEPNATEIANRKASTQAGITSMRVRVPDDFKHIRVNGAFQVQIFQAEGPNTVYVYGPNAGVRATAVRVRGKTLVVQQILDKENPIAPHIMRRVIVRIGIGQLKSLVQQGCGSIEAMRIKSDELCVVATPKACGNVYVSGQVNLKEVVNDGDAAINVTGAVTPSLKVRTSAAGSVNVAGKVGIQSIKHDGCGDINIVGANTDSLTIDASGKGKIGLDGPVILKRLRVQDEVHVYLSSVDGDVMKVALEDKARVGLAGCARNLWVDTFGSADFYGRYLCTRNAYVRSYDKSHANVTASTKIFAAAAGKSSIFFFGPENLLSSFANGSGAIIPMGRVSWCNIRSEYRPYAYTDAYPGEVTVYVPSERQRRMNYKGE